MESLNSLFKSVFFGIAAVGLGFLADKFGPRIALIWSHTLGIITIFILLKLYKLIKKES